MKAIQAAKKAKVFSRNLKRILGLKIEQVDSTKLMMLKNSKFK